MLLVKTAETVDTLTLTWTPPANVGGYVLYAAGQVVSTATARLKDGTLRRQAKFHKSNPGPPFEVVAVTRVVDVFMLEVGHYPAVAEIVYPSLTRYPSETI